MINTALSLLVVLPLQTGTADHQPAHPAIQGDAMLHLVASDDTDRRARRRDFDSEGTIACAQEQGQALGMCVIGVARDETGHATAAITFANNFTRRLRFEQGEFIRGNATMSGVGTDTDWRLEDGLYRIRVDDQRFEIPETLITGE